MKRFVSALLFLFCFCRAGGDEYLDTSASRAGMTFYCSFDGKLSADQAMGESRGVFTGNSKTSFVPGLKKQALRIGADKAGKNRRMLRFPALNNMDIRQGTLLFWFKPVDWSVQKARFQHLVSGRGKSAFFCYKLTNGKLAVFEGAGKKNGHIPFDISRWQDGEWHHYAVVWTPGSWQLYIDGQLTGTMKRDAAWSKEPWKNLYIGALAWGENRVRGWTDIDELKIFNRPFKADEIVNECNELGSLVRSSLDRFILRSGRSTAQTDGVIRPGEYAASGNGFLTLQGSYSPVQARWYLGVDDKYLYAAMDSPMEKAPLAKVSHRDGPVYADDSVELDILCGDKSIKQIVVNTRNVVYDSKRLEKNNSEWDLKDLKTASVIRNGRWIVEMAVPLKELGAPDKNGRYGLNFCRALLDTQATTRGICIAPVRRKFLDTVRFIDFYPDPGAPSYTVSFGGNLNTGAVEIRASSGVPVQLRANYLNSGRIWFDEKKETGVSGAVIRRSMPPNGMLTTELSQKGKILYRSMLTGKVPSPLTVQYICTDIPGQRLQIAVKNESGTPGNALLVQLKERKKGLVKLEKRFSVAGGSIFSEIFLDLSRLPAGDYDVCCTSLDAAGKVQKGQFIQILRKPGARESWRNNKTGVFPGEVPPPWTPIRIKGSSLAFKMQSYRFGKSLFPDWFGTHQNNLFTRPAELLINRKAVRNAVFSIVKSAPDVVYARSDGYVDNVRVRADFRFEYDGMMWVKLTLNGKGVLVKNLELHFPLRRAEGHLVHSNSSVDTHTASFGGNGVLGEKIWHKNLYSSPVFWVGGDNLGLCWFAENLKNWRNTRVNNSVEIIPYGSGERLVRLCMIDRPVRIDGDYVFEFGLQGSPVKPPAPRNDVRRWSYKDHSSTYFDYHDPAPEFFLKEEHQKSREFWKKSGFPYFQYCSSNGFSPFAPEWAWYCKEWIAGRIGQYIIEYPIRTREERNRYFWTFGCLNSRSFFDFKTWQIGRFITHPAYALDNMYFDLVGPRLCDNAAHGCSWTDSYGNLWPSFNVMAVREFQKRMYHLTKKKNPDFMHMLHMTGRAKVLPVAAFADCVVDGETFYGNEVVDKENYYGVFTPEFFRSSYQTGSMGFDLVFIPQLVRAAGMRRPDRVKLWRADPPPPEMYRALRHFAGYALTHNVFIWEWDPWTRKTVRRLYDEQLKHFGSLRNLRFISYWENEKPWLVACSSPGRTLVSAMQGRRKAAMYLLNDTPETQKITVTVDTEKLLGSPSMRLRDFEKELPAVPKGNSFTVTLPPRYFSVCFLSAAQ